MYKQWNHYNPLTLIRVYGYNRSICWSIVKFYRRTLEKEVEEESVIDIVFVTYIIFGLCE